MSNLLMVDSPELHNLNWSDHCSPKDVVVPSPLPREPAFVSTVNWLEERVAIVRRRYEAKDTDMSRVAPMALVRCSRGGKTRALQEIARKLKADLPETAVVYVTFNDSSNLQQWEQDDPLGALCRRIAFASFRHRDFEDSEQYENFATARVSSDEIIAWLGTTPCILLIDELNLLVELNKRDSSVAIEFAFFLRTFLTLENRYFIFSSHVLSTTGRLMDFMERFNSRQVDVQELPLIPSLSIAREIFKHPLLSAREALYFALVPALIFTSTVDLGLLVAKQVSAINACLDENLVTNQSVTLLLMSFVTGDKTLVIPPLLQLMTAKPRPDRPGDSSIAWIPFHMEEVLMQFSNSGNLSQQLKIVIYNIGILFRQFRYAKENNGDAWDCLFVIALLIRVATGRFEDTVLPLCWWYSYSFSYNRHVGEGGRGDDLDAYLKSMAEPDSAPHVAIYYPQHAQFPTYDVIVAVYDANRVRQLYGYQMKEGSDRPDNGPDNRFTKNILVRGLARKNIKNDWISLTENENDIFFWRFWETLDPRKLGKVMQPL